MKMMIKTFLKWVISKLYRKHDFRFLNKSYSQEGEDLILHRYFNNDTTGFYVDVGAYHPAEYSNTFLFYKMGWRGINIEARPGSKKLFDKMREKDINIEAAISDEAKELTYYKFNEAALNSFSKEVVNKRKEINGIDIIEKIKIPALTLKEVLDKFLPSQTKINFMSIDVEGLDFNVLKSNDWKKYRPVFLLTEDSSLDLMNLKKSEIFSYLTDKNYILIAKSYNTLFFKDSLK